MPAELAVIAGVLLVSAALQTFTGFGFALLSAPVLGALLGPAEAVATITATGVVVDVLVLAAGGRRPQPHVAELVQLWVWSVPGLVLGATLLTALPETALHLVVAGAVLLAVLHRALDGRRAASPRPGGPSPEPLPSAGPAPDPLPPAGPAPGPRSAGGRWWWWPAALAGLSSGALSTATTLGGPPVVMFLTRRPRPARQTRDTLVALALLRLPVSLAALWFSGAWVQPSSLPLLWVAVAAGYLLGRWVFARLDAARYRRAVLLTLLVSGVTAVISALT